MKALLVAVAVANLVILSKFAQAADVDWKYYGGLKTDETTQCFYDAGGVVHQPDGHLRVWIKCLAEKEITGIDINSDLGKKIIEKTAGQLVKYYIPPIGTVSDLNSDQTMTIIQYEVTADIGDIDPTARILYEINCRDKMMRELSLFFNTGNKVGSTDKAADWKYIPPEGNAANLEKILCPSNN